ncbi:hypothetical protein HID58_079386 [Brassica napus]|uniref:Uncharacterized protein n=1 Tax=Brassica napus TaxID=3708 RepID=A0ABQ7Y1W4_BRANA|nr:hypothetical protein HID58_079386 [Brassica napus]
MSKLGNTLRSRLVIYLLVLPLRVSAAAEEENDFSCSVPVNSATGLKYKIIAIFSTLIIGFFGGDLIHVHNKTQHDHNNIRRKLLTHVLESGIVVYSIIVGIALGASSSVSTIKPFIGAITIHQLLEGFRPRRCISKAKFELKKILIMVILYSLTTLVGIGISI